MSRFIAVAFCLLSFFSTSSLAADEAKGPKHDLEESLHAMSFPLARACVKAITHQGYSRFDLSGIAPFLLPPALFCDVIGFGVGAIATPINATRLLVQDIKQKWKAHHQDPDQQLIQMAINGLDIRLGQLETFLTVGDEFSKDDQLVLLLALTAWDSRESAPEAIKLATGDMVSREQADDLGAGDIFDALASASSRLSKINNQNIFMIELIKQIKSNNQNRNSMYRRLQKVAKLVDKFLAKHNK